MINKKRKKMRKNKMTEIVAKRVASLPLWNSWNNHNGPMYIHDATIVRSVRQIKFYLACASMACPVQLQVVSEEPLTPYSLENRVLHVCG